VRVSRVRLTVRQLMAAVAVVGALLAGYVWGQRMLRLSKEYAVHEYQFARYVKWSSDILTESEDKVVFFTKKAETDPERAERWRARASMWAKSAEMERERIPKLSLMRRRYGRLVFRPWEPAPRTFVGALPPPPIPR
jgi:hypothetical protein